jgi:hypothetical protein
VAVAVAVAVAVVNDSGKRRTNSLIAGQALGSLNHLLFKVRHPQHEYGLWVFCFRSASEQGDTRLGLVWLLGHEPPKVVHPAGIPAVSSALVPLCCCCEIWFPSAHAKLEQHTVVVDPVGRAVLRGKQCPLDSLVAIHLDSQSLCVHGTELSCGYSVTLLCGQVEPLCGCGWIAWHTEPVDERDAHEALPVCIALLCCHKSPTMRLDVCFNTLGIPWRTPRPDKNGVIDLRRGETLLCGQPEQPRCFGVALIEMGIRDDVMGVG